MFFGDFSYVEYDSLFAERLSLLGTLFYIQNCISYKRRQPTSSDTTCKGEYFLSEASSPVPLICSRRFTKISHKSNSFFLRRRVKTSGTYGRDWCTGRRQKLFSFAYRIGSLFKTKSQLHVILYLEVFNNLISGARSFVPLS